MDHLIEGFRNFRQNLWPENRALFHSLATRGQAPRVMVIACADFAGRPADDLLGRAGRDLHGAQRRQPGAALRAQQRLPRHQRRPRVRRARGSRSSTSSCSAMPTAAACARCCVAPTPRRAATSSIPGCASRRPRASGRLPRRRETRRRRSTSASTKASGSRSKTSRHFRGLKERVAEGSLVLHGRYFGIESGQLLMLNKSGEFQPVL